MENIVVLLLVFAGLLLFCHDAQSAQKINILYVNDETNTIADDSLNVVLTYLQRKTNTESPDLNIMKVKGNGTDAQEFLDKLCKVYNDSIEAKTPPHLVLDTTTSGVPSEVVKSFTHALALPTFTASYGQEGDLRQWRNLDEDRTKYLVQINPPPDMVTEVVRVIAYMQNISNAGVFFDDSIVMDHKYKSLLENMPTRHLIVKVKEDKNALKDQLDRLRKLDIFNYFIIGKISTIKDVLNAAQEIHFFERYFAWHAITLETEKLTCTCTNASVMLLQPVIDPECKDRLKDLQDNYGLKGQPEINAAFYFDFILRSILTINTLLDKGEFPELKYTTCDEYEESSPPTRDGVNLDILTTFKEIQEPPSYAPIVMDAENMNGYNFMKYKLRADQIDIVNNWQEKSTEFGFWNVSFDEEMTVSNPEKMINFSAITFYRVVTVVQAPFIMYDYVDKGKQYFKGYCVDLLNEIRNQTDPPFEYDIYEAPDKKFGNMDDKAQWNGMIKELMDKRADIALGSLSVMAERENVVDFTVPYYDLVGITILMLKPKAPTSLFKFLTVLENDVWLCILAAYFFTSFLMWVFDRWSPYSYQNNREKYKDDEEKREFNLKECLWFCMTSLTPQGGGEAPKNLSGRLVAATWWLFGFIIIASYTANLAAFLTVSRLDTPVESLEDLSKQYKIQYAPLNGSSAMTYFQRMADIENRFYEIWKDMSLNDSLSELERSKLAVWDYPVSDKYTKIWQAMKEAEFPATLEAAVERVRKSRTSSEGFAFLGDATDIRYLVLTNCDLQMVGEEFSRKPYAIAVQQGSPLKDQFNNAILQLLNKRKLEKLKEKWWTNNPEKKTNCEKADDQSDGISIQNIGGVFIVIFVGIGMACLTLAFEYWWYKHKKNPKVLDVGPNGPPQKPLPPPTKLETGVSMGFRPRNPFNDKFKRQGAALAGVTNPW